MHALNLYEGGEGTDLHAHDRVFTYLWGLELEKEEDNQMPSSPIGYTWQGQRYQ